MEISHSIQQDLPLYVRFSTEIMQIVSLSLNLKNSLEQGHQKSAGLAFIDPAHPAHQTEDVPKGNDAKAAGRKPYHNRNLNAVCDCQNNRSISSIL